MEQNNMLKHYLIIGFIISLIAIIGSCKDDYYDQFGEFYFVNETNYNITYEFGIEKFNVAPKSTTIIKEKFRGEGNEATASNYVSPLSYYGKELHIKFNNMKCLINVKDDDINSVRNIKNFIAKKVGENNYRFTYTFTEADYTRAVTCP